MSEMPSLTTARHRDNLEKCLKCLKNYLNKKDSSNHQDYALNAEELRLAIKWLGLITGHVTTENVLDVIFNDFCIGK
jgi:tRNA modification GTPase